MDLTPWLKKRRITKERLSIVDKRSTYLFLIDLNNQEIGFFPEEGRIGNVDNLVAADVIDFVRTYRLLCQDFSFRCVGVDRLKRTLVGFGKERAVEIAFHNLRFTQEFLFEQIMRFQFRL